MNPFRYDPPSAYSLPGYLKKYLRNRGISTRALSEIPVDLIREAQLELVFDSMESIMLPPSVKDEHAASPVLKQMLVTRIGSCDRAKGHYIPRPEGTPETVIHFCKEGEGWLRTRTGLHVIKKGEAFFIPPTQPLAYGASYDKPWSILWVHTQGGLVEQFLEALQITHESPVFSVIDMRQIEALHAKVFEQMEQRHTLASLVSTSGKLYDLLAYLVSEQQGPAMSPVGSHVKQAISYMEANLHRSLTLKDMANSVSLSVSRFSYLFRQAEGISPSAYFSQRRMQQAARHLLSNQLSISEVSRKMGYDDPYYFSRVFKSATGKSPRDYRKNFQR